MNISNRIIGVIPARYKSTRLRGKPLIKISGKSMIQHVWESASKSKFIDLVIVATDDKRIYEKVIDFGGEVIMTSNKHKSGTDRVFEVVRSMKCNIVVNIQGDEPFINSIDIDKAIKSLLINKDANVSTLCYKINKKDEIDNPNIVKVISDNNKNAVYFSRYPIPFKRNKSYKIKYYKHIGLYVFKKDFLKRYVKMKQSRLEKAENLEQLRILENGEKINVVETKHDSISIDTKEDLKRIKKFRKY